MRLAVAPEAEGPQPDAPGVLLAPDSFGGWRTAPDVARRLQDALSDHGVAARAHPLADGGEGTLEALLSHRPGVVRAQEVPGPLRTPRPGRFARVGGRTVVESASVLGPDPRPDPLRASSFGLGVLLCAAARERRGDLVVALGGTSTVDGGLGLLQALHLRALDGDGRALPPGAGAADLARIRRIEGDPIGLGPVVAWCDVRTPLAEAAPVFGPQKGLSPADIPAVQAGHAALADALDDWRARRGRPRLLRTLEGGGAAGGLGFALAALDARLTAGAAAIADLTGLDAALDASHTVVLGEGRLDPTSLQGKVAGTVLDRARLRGLRVVALVGQAAELPAPPAGPDAVLTCDPDLDRDTALTRAAARLARLLRG